MGSGRHSVALMRRREGPPFSSHQLVRGNRRKLSVEGTLEVPIDDGATTQRRAHPRRAQCRTARSCAELREPVGAGPDATPALWPTVERQIPAVPARILNPGWWRLFVVRPWKEGSRVHLFEDRAALLELRLACVELSLRGKLSSAWVTTCLKSRQRTEDALRLALSTAMLESLAWQKNGDIDWRRRHVPSAKNVANAASWWADAGSRERIHAQSASKKSGGQTGQRGGKIPGTAPVGKSLCRSSQDPEIVPQAPRWACLVEWRGVGEQTIESLQILYQGTHPFMAPNAAGRLSAQGDLWQERKKE